MKLNTKAFTLTCGLVWGFAVFLMTWWIIAFDGTTGEIPFLGRIYRGYNISPAGSVIGLLWGLLDGAIGGLIFALIYNFFAGPCKKEEKIQ